MLTYEQARTLLLDAVTPLNVESVPLQQAAGRVLRESVTARFDVPSFDASTMDGYAVATSDLRGEGPWRVAVSAESRAGREAAALAPMSACRIFTGAPMPARADAVIPQEDVGLDEGGGAIAITKRPLARACVRPRGNDMREGAIAVQMGTRITPATLCAIAAADRGRVVVSRRPRVAIVCTGDELREAGDIGANSAQIPDSISAALAAMASQAAGVEHVSSVPDRADAIEQAIDAAMIRCDLTITVGGVSVGDHDLVRPALERLGIELDFWRVKMKPGKPIAYGRRRAAHLLGLPGNPASALVTFALFGMPLLRAMQGDTKPTAMAVRARLSAAYKKSARVEFIRVRLEEKEGELWAIPAENQLSATTASLASSDGLAKIEAGEGAVEKGENVSVTRWDCV